MLTIDLHGLSLAEAMAKLEKTILSAVQFKERVIRVIHGQGKHSEVFPVIKSNVRRWLETSDIAMEHVESFFRGEEGSPYTPVNPGETVIQLKGLVPLPQTKENVAEWEDEFEARKNAKAMRADRLRKVRRGKPGR